MAQGPRIGHFPVRISTNYNIRSAGSQIESTGFPHVPARIYALAKELKVDSKDLVDLVKKVGITGKGSALASLTDEEAQIVRDHLSGAGKPEPVAAPVATTAPTAVRDVVPTERKHVAIKVGRSSRRNAAADTPEKPAKRETPAPKTPVPVEPVAKAKVVPEKNEEASQDEGPAPQAPKSGSLRSPAAKATRFFSPPLKEESFLSIMS